MLCFSVGSQKGARGPALSTVLLRPSPQCGCHLLVAGGAGTGAIYINVGAGWCCLLSFLSFLCAKQ